MHFASPHSGALEPHLQHAGRVRTEGRRGGAHVLLEGLAARRELDEGDDPAAVLIHLGVVGAAQGEGEGSSAGWGAGWSSSTYGRSVS